MSDNLYPFAKPAPVPTGDFHADLVAHLTYCINERRMDWDQLAHEVERLMRHAQALRSCETESVPDDPQFPGMHGIRILGRAPLTLPAPEWNP